MTRFVGELYPFQSEGLEFLTSGRRRLLADDVGLGKTVQIAAAIGRLWEPELMRFRPTAGGLGEYRAIGAPVLYFTVAGLVRQTAAELSTRLPSLRVETVRNSRRGGRSSNARIGDVLVVSHEFVHANADRFERLKPGLAVVDEASALKGGGVEFESLRVICDQARRVIVATATPFENHPLELWTILELVGQGHLGADQDVFLDRYCRVAYFDGKVKVEGWRSDERAVEAMQLVSKDFLRRRAGDVTLRLPQPEKSEPFLVPLTAEQSAAYKRAEHVGNHLSRHKRQHKIARGTDYGSPLAHAAVDIVAAEVEQHRKVVVYTEYLEDLNTLSRLLDQRGIGHVELRGATSHANRQDAVDVFRTDPGTPVLLGSRVLEYGLNLQFANTLVSVGVSYNPAREGQREGRLRRIGSPNATYRHHVVLPDAPIATKQLAALSRKRADGEHVLGRN